MASSSVMQILPCVGLRRERRCYLATFLSQCSVAIIVATLCVVPVVGSANLLESSNGWQTFSKNSELRSNYVMIPKYLQDNHAQMVSGAKFAQLKGVSKSPSAPSIIDYYPDRGNEKQNQIDMVNDAVQGGARAILIANNAGEDIESHTIAAEQAGLVVVSYDSPIRGGSDAGEALFVSGVDFGKTGETGKVMAEMALNILGPELESKGGDLCIMSTTPDATNQKIWIESMNNTIATDEKYKNLNLVRTFWPETDNNDGFTKLALEIVELKLNGTHPNLRLIVTPTTSGSAAAARALKDNNHCKIMQVSGLAAPAEMLEATQNGCAPEFALFNNFDLGYLAYMATHAISTGLIEGKSGDVVNAGRLGPKVIEADPSRGSSNESVKLLLGGFTRYNITNVEHYAVIDCIQGHCGDSIIYLQARFMDKYKTYALAIIPKITGAISFICSSYLTISILTKRQRRSKPLERMWCGLSVANMITSFFGFFLSTWLMPKDPKYSFMVYGAKGTTITCSTQGFLFQLGILATPLYSMSLATYYLLTCVFGWNDEKFKKIELAAHSIPWLLGLSTAITGLAKKMYNPSNRGSICWIEEYPAYCQSSSTCMRGENSYIYRWVFLYGFVIAACLWLTICMIYMWYYVLGVERRMDRYGEERNRRRRYSCKVAAQGRAFIISFIVPWVGGLAIYFLDTKDFKGDSVDNIITWLRIANAVIFPLQGFFNFMVYNRPQVRKGYKIVRERSVKFLYRASDEVVNRRNTAV